MTTQKRLKVHAFNPPRWLIGAAISLLLAALMHFYFTYIDPNARISSLAYNSKSPFLMMFCISMVFVCAITLGPDVVELLSEGRRPTPEQTGMLVMVTASILIVVGLFTFQDCRQLEIEFRVTQGGDISVLYPGEIYPARSGPGVTIEARDQANLNTPFTCSWKGSTNAMQILTPDRCETLVKVSGPGVVILELDARAPRCTDRVLAPLTIFWK